MRSYSEGGIAGVVFPSLKFAAVAGIIAIAACTFATIGHAHMPKECLVHLEQMHQRMGLYQSSLGEVGRLTRNTEGTLYAALRSRSSDRKADALLHLLTVQLPDMLDQVGRTIKLSAPMMESATAAITCTEDGVRSESSVPNPDPGKPALQDFEIRQSCMVKARLADRTREATEKAQLEIDIAGLSPLYQRMARLDHERSIVIERERRHRENVERCQTEASR